MSKVIVVMYHYVRDLKYSRYPKIKGLDASLFKKQIEFFKNNFNFIKIEELIASYETNYELPENAMLLTFDDGYIDHYNVVFPILAENNVQGSFYIPGKTFVEHKLLDVSKIHFILASAQIERLVYKIFEQLDYYRGNEYDIESNDVLFEKYAINNRFDSKEVIFVKRILQTGLPEKLRNMIASNLFTEFIGIDEKIFAKELYMSYEQIKCMKNNGMHIGLHGYDHYWLGDLDCVQMENDIKKALACMDGLINSASWVMNYPYGSWNKSVIEVIKQNGCKIGLTTEVKIADTEIDNSFLLPRLDTNDFPPKSDRYLKY